MTFDDILARCIGALEQGATIEQCVRQYPAHATALEPLLRLAMDLTVESKTQMSPLAFARGRAAVATRARQPQAPPASVHRDHRQPPLSVRKALPMQAPYAQNGRRPAPRPATTQRAWWRLGVPRFLHVAFLLLALVGATTVIRAVTVSLPGTWLYPIRGTGEQLVTVLMTAAGEEIAWHATQAEHRLQELATLPPTATGTAQALAQTVEAHWDAVLAASLRLPVDERTATLQRYIARLQQLHTAWSAPQGDAPLAAVQTVHKLITVGEQVLDATQPADQIATLTPTATLPATPTATATPVATTTPLLQASPTAFSAMPVLVASATPTARPVVPPAADLPAPATATPAPPTATPMPESPMLEITAQMPLQQSPNNQSDDEDEHEVEVEEDQTSATDIAVTTPVPSPTITETPTPDLTSGPITPEHTLEATATTATTNTGEPTTDPTQATPASTPLPTTEPPTSTPTSEPAQPLPPSVDTATPAPTKVPPQSTATSTPKPTNPPTATKTPKPTEKSAGATSQPTPNATADEDETPPVEPTTSLAPPTTPRPTMPSGNVTKIAQP